MKNLMRPAAIMVLFMFLSISSNVKGQNKQNMQRLDYTMDIHFDAAKNYFSGYQKLIYQNDSSDTLENIFYHLFYNAFQPGSQMENRAHYIRDQDGFYSTIQGLKAEDRGFEQIDSLKINGEVQNYVVTGTILKINPSHRVNPGVTIIMELWFKSQVPEMIVRTGKNNPEQ